MIYLCSVIAQYHCTTLWFISLDFILQYYVLFLFYITTVIMYNIIIVLYKQNILVVVVVVVGIFSGKNGSLIVLFQPH